MAECNRRFSSLQEEVDYWKDVAAKYKESFESATEELNEFQSSSRELEVELEAQLTQAENKNKELTLSCSRLQMELETVREKLEKLQYSSHHQISELETKLAKVEAYNDALQKYVRELEQANDDLERAKRAAVVSLEDFELRLNQAIERNAFLESELDEKENLVIFVQRLKDEARDLRQEIAVHQKKEESSNSVDDSDIRTAESDVRITANPPGSPGGSCSLAAEQLSNRQHNALTENYSNSFQNSDNPEQCNSIPPAMRVAALNIVGDLLRKVGVLESKLASCQTAQRIRECSIPSNMTSSKRFSIPGSMPPSAVSHPGFVQITV